MPPCVQHLSDFNVTGFQILTVAMYERLHVASVLSSYLMIHVVRHVHNYCKYYSPRCWGPQTLCNYLQSQTWNSVSMLYDISWEAMCKCLLTPERSPTTEKRNDGSSSLLKLSWSRLLTEAWVTQRHLDPWKIPLHPGWVLKKAVLLELPAWPAGGSIKVSPSSNCSLFL